MLNQNEYDLRDEELEDVNGGVTLTPYTTPFEMPDEPQLSNLKAAIRKMQCRCIGRDLTDQEVNTIIEQYVLPGYWGFPCPRCGTIINARSLMYVICG